MLSRDRLLVWSHHDSFKKNTHCRHIHNTWYSWCFSTDMAGERCKKVRMHFLQYKKIHSHPGKCWFYMHINLYSTGSKIPVCKCSLKVSMLTHISIDFSHLWCHHKGTVCALITHMKEWSCGYFIPKQKNIHIP